MEQPKVKVRDADGQDHGIKSVRAMYWNDAGEITSILINYLDSYMYPMTMVMIPDGDGFTNRTGNLIAEFATTPFTHENIMAAGEWKVSDFLGSETIYQYRQFDSEQNIDYTIYLRDHNGSISLIFEYYDGGTLTIVDRIQVNTMEEFQFIFNRLLVYEKNYGRDSNN
jgi:hypothetical protein